MAANPKTDAISAAPARVQLAAHGTPRQWRTSTAILLKLGAPILLGFLVNLVSNAVSANGPLDRVPLQLGWWWLLAPVGLSMLIADFWNDLRNRRHMTTAAREAHEEALRVIRQTNRRIFSLLLSLLAKSTRNQTGVNVHLFWRRSVDGRTALVKDRNIFYETEQFPHNYALDLAYPDTDELVICDAFNRDQVLYEELPITHPERYNERIQGKVDANITWVLACPMHIEHARPRGIVCFFGERRIFSGEPDRRSFESMLVIASEIMALMSELEDVEGEHAGHAP